MLFSLLALFFPSVGDFYMKVLQDVFPGLMN